MHGVDAGSLGELYSGEEGFSRFMRGMRPGVGAICGVNAGAAENGQQRRDIFPTTLRCQ